MREGDCGHGRSGIRSGLLFPLSSHLRPAAKTVKRMPMKLALAVLVYLLMGLVLSVGILLLLAGKPWFLLAALAIYIVAFGRIGCITH